MKRPGGPLSSRPLPVIFIADCSGSMHTAGKIQSLNAAVREALPHLRNVAHDNPNAQVTVRTIAFSTGARWMTDRAVRVEEFTWTDLTAGGVTDMGRALSMVAAELRIPPRSRRSLQPVLVLITDGQPTDRYEEGLRELLHEPWGEKSIRIAIAIGGRDVDYEVLERFIDDPNRKPLTANNSAELVDLIRWASTTPVRLASAPPIARTAGEADLATPVFTPSAVAPTADIASTPW